MSADRYYNILDQTWPAARTFHIEGWVVRQGLGGGSRVSAATATSPDADPALMEDAQAGLNQVAVVRVQSGDEAIDARLAQQGYIKRDETILMEAPVAKIAAPPPPVTAFTVAWPPLFVQTELWADHGIKAPRIAVMARAANPKCTLLGRLHDQIAGTGFVACTGEIAMAHAIEVHPDFRRQNLARNMMRAAAIWAQDQGARRLCVAVTHANTGARALYASLGMRTVGHYHYREKPHTT